MRPLIIIVSVVEGGGPCLFIRSSELSLFLPEDVNLPLEVFVFALQDLDQLIGLL